ncbi:hypothetical protein [Chryseobacterium sp. 6424]|nr:hypothetical protein [Chryseobacterium sp. 6424]
MKENFVILKDFMTEVRDEEVTVTLFYVPENEGLAFGDTVSLYLPYNQY